MVVGLIQDHSRIHPEKKLYKSEHGPQGSQKVYFQAYIIQCHGPTDFAAIMAREVHTMRKLGDHSKEMNVVFVCTNISILFLVQMFS